MIQVTPYSNGTKYPGRSAYNRHPTCTERSCSVTQHCVSCRQWCNLALFGSECADHLPTMRCAGMQLSLPLLRVPFVLPFSPPSTICTTAFCVQRSHAACQVAAPTMWRAHIAAELRCSVCCWVSCSPNAMLLFTPGAWNIL